MSGNTSTLTQQPEVTPFHAAACMFPPMSVHYHSNQRGFHSEPTPPSFFDQTIAPIFYATIANLISQGCFTAIQWTQKQIWGDPHVNARVFRQDLLVALNSPNCGNLARTKEVRDAALEALDGIMAYPELYRESRSAFQKCFQEPPQSPQPPKK